MTKKALLKQLVDKLVLQDKPFHYDKQFNSVNEFIDNISNGTISRLLFPRCSFAYKHSLKVCLEQLTLTSLDELKENIELYQMISEEQIDFCNSDL